MPYNKQQIENQAFCIKVQNGNEIQAIAGEVSHDQDYVRFRANTLRDYLNELYATHPDSEPMVLVPRNELTARVPATYSFFGGRAVINQLEQQLYVDEKPIAITARSYSIVQYLGKMPGVVRTVKEIYNDLWGGQYYPGGATVRVHISRIRDQSDRNIIQSKRGYGYFAPE